MSAVALRRVTLRVVVRCSLVNRTPLLLSFIVGSCHDLGRLFVSVLVVGSGRLAVVVLVVLADQFLESLLTIPARTSRVFGWSGFPSDQAGNVSARDAKYCRLSLMPITKLG